MNRIKGINNVRDEFRQTGVEYPRRVLTLEECCNILLHDINDILYNKIDNMSPYDRRDSGWDVVYSVIEEKMDILQSHLKDLNDETWEKNYNIKAPQ